jgi:hypothetical protein
VFASLAGRLPAGADTADAAAAFDILDALAGEALTASRRAAEMAGARGLEVDAVLAQIRHVRAATTETFRRHGTAGA